VQKVTGNRRLSNSLDRVDGALALNKIGWMVEYALAHQSASTGAFIQMCELSFAITFQGLVKEWSGWGWMLDCLKLKTAVVLWMTDISKKETPCL